MKRRIICLLFALLLFVCAFPASALEESEEAQEGEAAQERIMEMCKAAKKRSGKKSFKGYCGAYINHLMVVYGINTKYVKGNGNQIFDNYKNLEVTTGGYAVTAYDHREYTLEEALKEIASQGDVVHNVVIGFTRSPSEAGKKYGHCIYIDTIMNGNVYYSETFQVGKGEDAIKAGEPIVRSLEDFADYYRKYKLDGVLYFTLSTEKTTDMDLVDILEVEWTDTVTLEAETEEAIQAQP